MRVRHKDPRRALALAAALAAALVAAATRTASADSAGGAAGGAAEKPRPWAGAVGLGGYAAHGGPASTGLCAVAALYPGAWAGRLGLRLEARTAGGDDRKGGGLFTAGLAYEAAAARPRLALALHGEAGALLPDPRAALGGGVELELWLLGPVALALGSSAHLVVDGLDSELVLSASLGLRLAR